MSGLKLLDPTTYMKMANVISVVSYAFLGSTAKDTGAINNEQNQTTRNITFVVETVI